MNTETRLRKGPKGEKRPSDVIENAVLVMRIATGEADDTPPVSGRRRSGLAGAKARANALTAAERVEIGRRAAGIRWSKNG